jgi:heavy metal sensor kinase
MKTAPKSGGMRRHLRSLRFRLTISYVLIFGLLLTGIGFTFRFSLSGIIRDRVEELLHEDWDAARGFLRIERGQATWSVDPREVDQTVFVDRLRRILLLADSNGNVLELSNGYRLYGVESSTEIVEWFKTQKPEWKDKGAQEKARIRYGVFTSNGTSYLLAIGRRIGDIESVPDRFVTDYFTILPLLLLITGLIGWFMAGRALVPVNRLAETAQRISGSSLHLRIPMRFSNDELDKLIEAFNKMMERLSVSFEQIRRFSTDVSHELRTPITVIRGQLEVALMTASTPDEYREAISNALQDVDRLSRIVRALLLLAQAETGQLVLNKASVDLGRVVQDLVQEFGLVAEEAGVHLESHIEPNVLIHADKTQIERLVTNLVSNAVKYTPPPGRIEVSVRRAGSPESAIFSVRDTGCGIPAEKLPHIFDRFYRGTGGEPAKGLGLGLSFVAWIVKAHGGKIEVESTVGQGSTFTAQFTALPAVDKISERTPLAEARQ